LSFSVLRAIGAPHRRICFSTRQIGGRVSALVERELREQARPERASLLHASRRRPARVALLARAATYFDHVFAPLDPTWYPLVLDGAIALADGPNLLSARGASPIFGGDRPSRARRGAAHVLKRLKSNGNPLVLASYGSTGHGRPVVDDRGQALRLEEACASGGLHAQRVLDLNVRIEDAHGRSVEARVVCVPFGGEDRA
jgi:hypothetical protein